MSDAVLTRGAGLCCAVAGGALVALVVVHGGCLGDACNGRPLLGAAPGELGLAVATVCLLVAAGASLLAAAGRRTPVREARKATTLCALGAAGFGTATGVAVARTNGETWLMPFLVFPTLLLCLVAVIVVAIAVQRARLAPRWTTVAVIVAAALLPLFGQQDPNDFVPALVGAALVVLGANLAVRPFAACP